MRLTLSRLALSLLLVAFVTASCGGTGVNTLRSIPQRGVDVLWYYDGDTPSQITAKAHATFAYIAGLGANSVAINYPFYMSSPGSDTVSAGSGTPSPEQIGIAVQVAKGYHLRVMLRPLLDEQSFGTDSWRGTLRPRSRTRWFANYWQFLKGYLTVAQKTGVQQFAIGVELTSLQGDSRWRSLATQARQVFHGKLVYSNNWYRLQRNTAGSAADVQGIDAYFPVQLDDNASTDTIVAAWNKWLDGISPSVDINNMVFTEVGIPAQAGAYRKPYGGGMTGAHIEPLVQERWFTAACEVARQRNMPGIYYWKVTFGKVPDTFDATNAPPASIVDRGSVAVQACFKEG